MSDQQSSEPAPNDVPVGDSQEVTPSESVSDPHGLAKISEALGKAWNTGGGRSLSIKDSAGKPQLTLPLNFLILLLIAFIVPFGFYIVLIAGVVAKFVNNASFSFSKTDDDSA
ncbi:MAG: hypothetical protein AAF708_08055 [Deinococcota bacterium]